MAQTDVFERQQTDAPPLFNKIQAEAEFQAFKRKCL